MQYTLFKRTLRISYIYVAIDILIAIWGIINFDLWQSQRYLVMALFIIINVAFALWYQWYDVNVDRNILINKTSNGSFRLAKITEAKKWRKIRDTHGTKYYLWQIKGFMYDENGEISELNYVEKMNVDLENIPFGNVYITYDEKTKHHSILTIPNVLLGVSDISQAKVKQYESLKFKMQYLNVYYNKGIVIETFKQTLKSQNDQ